MQAVMIWNNCDLFSPGQDAFWVQCLSSELEAKILSHLDEKTKLLFLENKQRYLSTQWAEKNPNLLVKPNSYYFMVTRDGKGIQPTDPFFPYSSQWNGYCPLKEIEHIQIDSINDLNTILPSFPRKNIPNQRKGSPSNSSVGDAFEKVIKEYFLKMEGISFKKNFPVLIGLNSKKKHHFDLGYSDEKRTIIIECKSHKWTEGNNIPSAKLTVWNEAMYYFNLVDSGIEKRMVVLRDYSPRRQMTLAEYYIKTYGHLIPHDVSFYEYDEKEESMNLKKETSIPCMS